MILLLTLFLASVAAYDTTIEGQQLTGQAFVDYVRTHQNLFQVEESEKNNERMKHLMPASFLTTPNEEERIEVKADEEPPESFDARVQWPHCKDIIDTIRDQSYCGSCWAVSAAETMSDRLCVQSKGRYKLHLSDTDILACCGDSCGFGCEGGWPIKAWQYIMRYGVCTGGHYAAKGVCKPYAFHPCGNHKNQMYYGECPKESWPTPKCKKFCQRGYTKAYNKDKFYAKSAYSLPNDEKAIRLEIMKNGPVQAGYYVYEDFRLYKGGIYKHTTGARTGGHAVKIIGWGKEKINGTEVPYWIIANSWNTDWGESGYFRMIRGENNCNLEAMIYAGMMYV